MALSLIAGLTLLASTEGILLAQKMSVPKPLPDRSALAQEDVKELLLLMDTNQNGKITKQEWMKGSRVRPTRYQEDRRAGRERAGEIAITPQPICKSW
ncbi:MAG TPA: hypothetical protein VNX88_05300 [Terriglobales bacterium]|nr:hypothetical protein [Terriglobales bacterium]